jgi:hypothetical protein
MAFYFCLRSFYSLLARLRPMKSCRTRGIRETPAQQPMLPMGSLWIIAPLSQDPFELGNFTLNIAPWSVAIPTRAEQNLNAVIPVD